MAFLIPVPLSDCTYNVVYPTGGTDLALTIKDKVILELYLGSDWERKVREMYIYPR